MHTIIVLMIKLCFSYEIIHLIFFLNERKIDANDQGISIRARAMKPFYPFMYIARIQKQNIHCTFIFIFMFNVLWNSTDQINDKLTIRTDNIYIEKKELTKKGRRFDVVFLC